MNKKQLTDTLITLYPELAPFVENNRLNVNIMNYTKIIEILATYHISMYF